MIHEILRLLSALITVYTVLCFINILLSWFPGAKFTGFGRFLSGICDPYMDLFSRIPFLRIGNIDFSPIISLGLLSLASTILSRIQATGRIFIGGILASILGSLWSITSSLLSILFILVLIRWIFLLFSKGKTSYDSGWYQIDMMINKFSYKVAGTFTKKSVSYQTSLLITWIAFLVIMVAGNVLINILCNLCVMLPF